jgi:hypothetical protein
MEDMAMMVVELAHPTHGAKAAGLSRRPNPPTKKIQLPPRSVQPEAEAEDDRIVYRTEPQSWPRIFPGL